MNGALRYLLARSLANRARRAIRTLRRPWAVTGLVAGLAFLVVLARFGGHGEPAPAEALWTGALGLLLLTVTMWVAGAAARKPGFGGARRLLLLPAPVPRASLVDLDIVRSQGAVLANVGLWTLLSGPLSLAGAARQAIALWLLFTTLGLHRSLVARVRGFAGARLAWLRGALVVAGLMLVAAIPFLLNGSSAFREVFRFTPSPLGEAILGIFSVPLRPLVAPDTAQWMSALPAAVGLAAAHVILLRLLGPDSEPRAPERLASGRALLSVRGLGPPGAVVWKAITALVRRPLALAGITGLGAAVLLLIVLRASGRPDAAEFAGYLALTWAPIVLLTGPQFLRTGARRDADLWPLLRTLPVSGRQWLLGGALGGGVVLTALVMALLLIAAAATPASAELPLDAGARNGLVLLAPAVLVPLATLVYLVQECLGLYAPMTMPASFHPGPARLGSSLLNATLSSALVATALLPVAGLALVLWRHLAVAAMPKLVLILLAAAVVLAWECRAAAAWLGGRFERLAGERT